MFHPTVETTDIPGTRGRDRERGPWHVQVTCLDVRFETSRQAVEWAASKIADLDPTRYRAGAVPVPGLIAKAA